MQESDHTLMSSTRAIRQVRSSQGTASRGLSWHHPTARAPLDAREVAYEFHDYKASGVERARLEAWAGEVGWEALLNRAGTTFRKLPDARKDGLTAAKAIALMLEQPSMIKRPVLDVG